MEARGLVGYDGAAVGAALAEHANAGLRDGVSGDVPVRGDSALGGSGDDAAVRAGGGAVGGAVQVGGGAGGAQAAGGDVPAAVVPTGVSQAQGRGVRWGAGACDGSGGVPAGGDGDPHDRGGEEAVAEGVWVEGGLERESERDQGD